VTVFAQIKAALAIKRAANQFQKEKSMGADPVVSVVKGLKAIGAFLLFAGLSAVGLALADEQALGALLAALNIHSAYVGVAILVARGVSTAILNYIKNNGPNDPNRFLVVLFAILAAPALVTAQDAAPTQRPDPVTITLYGGAMRTAERGKADSNDFTYRLTVQVPAPSDVTVFGRADWTRTQDGGSLTDPATFRSVEAVAGARKQVATGIEAFAFSGVTWSREDAFVPADPRLWTLAVGVRGSIAGKGSAQVAFGHHGPVGGPALLGSLSYLVGDSASYFADVAIPTDAERFRMRPYTARFGISARLKRWRF